MPEITDLEFQDYENLKNLYLTEKFQKIQDSLNLITKLEDDIDQPIKRLVAMFALLDCKPKFCCCGFNYIGQPIHKCHQIGELYFLLENKQRVHNLMSNFSDYGLVYYTRPEATAICYKISSGNPHWGKDCIHYTELAVGFIQYLENYLLRYKNDFLDVTILKDTNQEHKKDLKYWQYPPKADWIITKEWVLNETKTK